MKRSWPLWAALVVIAVGAAWAYESAAFTSRSSDGAPLYSTRRHDPYGTAALLDLLAERGVISEPVQHATLGEQHRGVLVEALSSLRSSSWRPAPRMPARHLADWIAKGNTVVQLSRTPTDLMTIFAIKAADGVAADAAMEVEEAEARGDDPVDLPGQVVAATLSDQSNGQLTLRRPMTFAERPNDPSFKVLARGPAARPATRPADYPIVACEFRSGRGRLVLIGAPSPALNYTIGDGANLEFMMGVIGAGPVYFDDWSHGLGHDATVIGFLVGAGLMPLIAQGAFIAGLFVWFSARKETPSGDNAHSGSVRSGAEQITTLGFLYDRSLGFNTTFDRVEAETADRLAHALRCRREDLAGRVAAFPQHLRIRYELLQAKLAEVRPAGDIRCPTCGYDLRGNHTGRCPECGSTLAPEIVHRISFTPIDAMQAGGRRARQAEAALAEAITLSHQLSQEIRRDPRRPK